ncbi:MAG: hypothetical protein GX659_01130 [Myxococcales bacterium]|nr:hypothetical protein [Myxococcales bacterium]
MSKNTFKILDNLGQELVEAGLISADQLAVVQETQKTLAETSVTYLFARVFSTANRYLNF